MIKRIHRRGCLRQIGCADFIRRRLAARDVVVEYEPDNELRDTEQIPLTEDGGIEGFLRREVLPYASGCLVFCRGV